jgi:periplasmic divalent cation tolerance protein
MTDTIVVTTTFDKKEDAVRLGKALLQKRLVACAQVSGPVDSLYWWKGEIEQAKEYKLLVKSTQSLWDSLREEIKGQHPYDIPEIISMKISDVNTEYQHWLLGELQK